MTQNTDKCLNRQLYTDISAWITDAKGLSVSERTGHHGQYEGLRVRFDPFDDICRHSSQYAPRMRNKLP